MLTNKCKFCGKLPANVYDRYCSPTCRDGARHIRAIERKNREPLKKESIVFGLIVMLQRVDLSRFSGLELQQVRDACTALVSSIDRQRVVTQRAIEQAENVVELGGRRA